MTMSTDSDMYVKRIEKTESSLKINGEEFPWFIAAEGGVTVEAPNGPNDIERHLVVRVLFFADDAETVGLDDTTEAAR